MCPNRDIIGYMHDFIVNSWAGRSLGFSSDLIRWKAMQGTPMRYRDMHVGTFFLTDKEGGQEFTAEDEEVLVLFASQVATAIANARTHQDEQRARSNLKALFDISPVGVVLFNAKTGQPVSLNKEAKRILVGLHMPDRPLEELLEVLTCRRTDGREITPNDLLTLTEEFKSAELVRAEEIVLSVPDGRSVKTLLNVMPILSEGGAVESTVVTLQDMTPLEQLERMRAEFLGMVSHELRTPLVPIKGCATTVLEASSVLDPAETLQFFRIINEQAQTGVMEIPTMRQRARVCISEGDEVDERNGPKKTIRFFRTTFYILWSEHF